MVTLSDVWAGDKLGRRQEAAALAKFLVSETAYLRRSERRHGFVLGLDAPYGEGKSWFLERLATQLSLNHPVARVDAWADDAGSDPLVALMASVEDTMSPFLHVSNVYDNFVKAKACILPIIGKGATALGGRIIGKYLGEDLKSEISDLLENYDIDRTDSDALLDQAGDAALKRVSSLIDRTAERMLDDYRTRKKSAKFFKERLADAVEALARSEIDAPIFIIIDELDRCRPDYAIRMLEEIKHIFDVPGIVFVIALHGKQLEKSINAVYGHGFDSADYLHRFFSRRYRLARPSVAELAATLFNDIGCSSDDFNYPDFWLDGKIAKHDPGVLIGSLLSYWKVSPRKVHQVIDCMRLFMTHWHHPIGVELVPLANCVVNWSISSENGMFSPLGRQGEPFNFFIAPRDGFRSSTNKQRVSPEQLISSYAMVMAQPLNKSAELTRQTEPNAWVASCLHEEFVRLHNNTFTGNSAPLSVLNDYPDIIESVGRFVEDEDDETNVQD